MNAINKKDRVYYFRYFDYNIEAWVHLKSPRSTKGQERLSGVYQRCEYGWFPKDQTEMLSKKVLMKGA